MNKSKTGLLISSSFGKIVGLLPMIQRDIIQTLYITLYPIDDNQKSNNSITFQQPIQNISTKIINTYSKTILYKNLDVRILLNKFNKQNIITKNSIDIIYFDSIFKDDNQIIKNCILNKSPDYKTIFLDSSEIDENEININSKQCNSTADPNKIYEHTVLGGTFDRLHTGHKILLSEAALRSSSKVTVGVTDTPMLYTKKCWEVIEPCNVRLKRVLEFLEDIDPTLDYTVVAINDMFGPTKDDPSFQMIVVSAETIGGGEKVNEARHTNGLNSLDVVSVPLIPADDKIDEQEEDKVSSSNLRMRELGLLRKPVEPKPHLPSSPYVIGLTGGIASGKSNIAKYLENLGASVINCDLLAHQMYAIGTPGNQRLRETFGENIALPDGSINRKALGAIVFGNKEEMEKLNNIVWPLLLEKVKSEIVKLKESHKVVVVEAAVLIPANWKEHFHEIWVTFIPEKEAIKRLQARNNLTESEAKARLKSQPSNLEYVTHADVLLSSAWDFDYTKKQVERAYSNLLKRLPNNTNVESSHSKPSRL